MIQHLIGRCLKSGYPVILAIPNKDYEQYKFLNKVFGHEGLTIHMGQPDDPLQRMYQAAKMHKLDAIFRVTHDKLFIEEAAVRMFVDHYERYSPDYLYSSSSVDGASFELIRFEALEKAAQKFKDIEYIGYAIRCLTDKIKDLYLGGVWQSDHRLLLDYPEDLAVLNLTLQNLGNDCSLTEAIRFLDKNEWLSRSNRMPKVTVYTCAYNAEKWLTKAMGSVSQQIGFKDMEYILIDDCSTDRTGLIMSKFCDVYKNARWIKNDTNLGLASSSNVALLSTRGRYLIRLDADDYFVDSNAIESLLENAGSQKVDVVYPDNFFGSFKKIQPGAEAHHVGGALFRTRAANHVKFTDGLRGYEGLDFFARAREQLKIGYLKKPIFFYRQHEGSLTKTNQEDREQIRSDILRKYGNVYKIQS